MKILRDVLPYQFDREFYDSKAAQYLDQEVIKEMDGCIVRWPGTHKYVYVWWKLANGKCVGWNENPGRGWSFPVAKYDH